MLPHETLIAKLTQLEQMADDIERYDACSALVRGYRSDFQACLQTVLPQEGHESGHGTVMQAIVTDANTSVQKYAIKEGIVLTKPHIRPVQPSAMVEELYAKLRPQYVSALAEFLEAHADVVTEANGRLALVKAIRTRHRSATAVSALVVEYGKDDFILSENS